MDEAADEVSRILDYLKAICEVIPAAREVSEETLHDLVHLARDLTEETKRRMQWLHDAGKATTASGEED